MGGHLVAAGPCGLCGARFTFDPETVPSIMLDMSTGLPPDVGGTPMEQGVAKPVCPACVKEFNAARRAAGLPVIWRES